ncbi:hypothetical protein CAEBREN_15921 [Caenorhabditis brenneri]|uniref:RRM domain-containing protein n=1 Tax=Caenorhabditis brenneri TaxID=135651 RepID=G0MM79_CAEBE|nr:hypothetical protein CAEBREN_15921 [Caenorhabditis brenneri]
MNGQADRCDRTAYVSGLQPTISDIELFELFNRVAHVEKVIVRNGAIRHALVVFKTVPGLYQVLVSFQGTSLHGRQLHIRPLRESSHANSEAISTMFEKAKGGTTGGGGIQKRHLSDNQNHGVSSTSPPPQYSSNYRNYHPQQHQQRGYRNSSGSTSSGAYGNQGRRRGGGGHGGNGYNRAFQNETYPGMTSLFDPSNVQQYSGFGGGQQSYHHNEPQMHFEDYAEGAKRHSENGASSASSSSCMAHRQRAASARHAPPTWKMELQIKNEQQEAQAAAAAAAAQQQLLKKEDDVVTPATAVPGGGAGPQTMTPQDFLAQIAMHTAAAAAAEKARNAENKRKARPNLSVINPSLFYEQYPRTSSPVVTYAPHSTPNDKNPSPHDPAVLAYSCLRAPQSAFDGLSPIDTNNCSFITKHLGNTSNFGNNAENEALQPKQRRDMTNDELSDMIVSTGNLRMNPVITADSMCDSMINPDEPAPWSPLKRLRAESGCNVTAQQMASPQFSPIQPKEVEETMDSEEDDVFGGTSSEPKIIAQDLEEKIVTAEQQKISSNFEDINNSRLPSNSHSAAPSSEQKSFVFPPEYPMCRHSSVPSIAHLVGDLSDFCPLSPHVVNEKLPESPPRHQEEEDVDKTSDDKSVEIQKARSEELLKALEI